MAVNSSVIESDFIESLSSDTKIAYQKEELLKFYAMSSLWTIKEDEALIRVLNLRCEKNEIRADSIKASTFTLTSSERALAMDCLDNMSASDISLRIVVLQTLNKNVEQVINLVDFSLPSGVSTLRDSFVSIRSLMFWTSKSDFWERSLDKTKTAPATFNLNLDIFKAGSLKEKNIVDTKAKKSLFGQAYQQLKDKDPSIYRIDKNKQCWKTVFVGNFADDYGGPYRASIVGMCNELQTSQLPLFCPTPNARVKVGSNRYTFNLVCI